LIVGGALLVLQLGKEERLRPSGFDEWKIVFLPLLKAARSNLD
jgi:hypothetical protein